MYICEAWPWRGDEESIFTLQPNQHGPRITSRREDVVDRHLWCMAGHETLDRDNTEVPG